MEPVVDAACTVFSLLSRYEVNNRCGPTEGGPEGTGKGKLQSTPAPKRRQRHYGTNPREKEPQGTVGFSSGHQEEAETSPEQPLRRPPSGGTADQHTPAPRPLVGKRGTFTEWPRFGPNPRKYVEESDPREPVARPPIGASQCRPSVMRKSSPSKQCDIQSTKYQVRQPPRAAAKTFKRTWANQTATSQPRSVRRASPTLRPRKPSIFRHGRSAGLVHHRPGRPATEGRQPPHVPYIKAERARPPLRTVAARLGGEAGGPSG